MDKNTSSPGTLGSSGSSEDNDLLSKICKVCGDKAKSYNFGGLCCESCKAFFRRAMQNDSYKSFFCTRNNTCSIRKDNRRSCQYCRIQKCYSIGMEKGWLRTEEEITRMKELKLSSKPKQVQVPVNCESEPISPSPAEVYKPRFEEIHQYLSPEEVNLIEHTIESYWKAYQKISFGVEVTQNSAPRTGLQVISMFTTGIRRWAAFARMMPEFLALCREDQAAILQAAVMQLSILRAVASFQMGDKEWRVNTPVHQFTPTLSLEDVQRLLSPQLAEMHLQFITSVQKLQVDEPIIMLLSLITLFTSERSGLMDSQLIARTQEHYILLLKRYCDWKYGLADRGRTFANLFAKLSDLRELSDLHSDHQVRFANQDLHKIYQEIDEPPHLNMDLNNTSHFLSAMEFSILKTHHTLPNPASASDPALRNLEQIEEICAGLQDQGDQGASALS